MIFMTKSKQRRDYMADRIRESLSNRDGDAGATGAAGNAPVSAPVSAEVPSTAWQRFTYQLPAWGLLLAFAAVPVVVLIILLNR